MNIESELLVTIQPIGKRVRVTAGTTLLQAAQASGIALASLCGGIGSCDSCKIRLVAGVLTPHTLEEQSVFSPDELQSGLRLACQAAPLSDTIIDIPPESLTAPQRLQIEGQGELLAVDSALSAAVLALPAPGLHDLRDDLTRVRAGFENIGRPAPDSVDYALLTTISETLRENEWTIQAVVRGNQLVALLPPKTPLLGLAVDIGTTKLAAYLCDLSSGKVLAKSGAMNPQISYGEDVITRIAYATTLERRKILQNRIIDSLNQLITALCNQACEQGLSVTPENILEAVIVGNTAMHHLFSGLPVTQLGVSPYVPAASQALELRAREIGLTTAPGAVVYLPPNIAGYVGADHVAMLLATGAWKATKTLIALDIGTNTEVTLAHDGQLYCCSCASGPAFEGAHIQAGMRAAPGAIERVQISDKQVRYQCIGDQPPVGLCGSGILDAIAEMLKAGIIDRRGSFQAVHPLVSRYAGKLEFTLVPEDLSAHKRPISINRHDINEIQLAKGAIRAGIEVLMRQAGISASQLDKFIIAGAFGTYININSAVRLGMFPDIPLDRFDQVGNAAGAGARQMLLSTKQRRQANEIARCVRYIELASNPDFTNEYSQALFFPA